MAGITVIVFFALMFFTGRIKGQRTKSGEEDDMLRPWQNPLQELQSITATCALKIPEITDIASSELYTWQTCVDKIVMDVTEKYPELDSRNRKLDADDKMNSSVIYEMDRQLHMVICRNRFAYKACWTGIIKALNKCDPGSGHISGRIYYALYDDICRDGGRVTVENRRRAALAGELCERDYSTDACILNQENRHAKDLCLRFQSNVVCDLSSVDPNCTNTVDKGLHADIFERVEKVLGCTESSHAQTSGTTSTQLIWNANSFFARFIVMFLTLLVKGIYV